MTFEQWLTEMRLYFPALTAANCRPTSPPDEDYNCIAWAAGNSERWWWPDPQEQSYWPPEVPRSETIAAFVQAYGLQGYREYSNATIEGGVEKVAVFANAADIPTHAARQIVGGWWASKLGKSIDIEHELTAIEGPAYGRVAVILSRRTASREPSEPSEMR